jgi:hypothetical protein
MLRLLKPTVAELSRSTFNVQWQMRSNADASPCARAQSLSESRGGELGADHPAERAKTARRFTTPIDRNRPSASL